MIRRNVALIVISNALFSFALGYLLWFLPATILEGEGPISVGATFTAASVCGAALAYAGGLLADLRGRKLVIVLGSLLSALGATALIGYTLPALILGAVASLAFLLAVPAVLALREREPA